MRRLTVERQELATLVETQAQLDDKLTLTPEEEQFDQAVDEVKGAIEMCSGGRYGMGEEIWVQDQIDIAQSLKDQL